MIGEESHAADPSSPFPGGDESVASQPAGAQPDEPDETQPDDVVDAEAERIAEDLRHLETDFPAAVGSADQTNVEGSGEAATAFDAEKLAAERDEYLEQLQRVQAEFQNYKRRVDTQRQEQRDQAAADLVKELLPVLDACDAAIAAGHEDVDPVRSALLHALERNGLAAVGEAGTSFDPNVHEAVLHEEGEGDAVVAEILRTGYLWHGRVVRAAMVKVRG